MGICACGCSGATQGGVFLPGHDQKLRTDIENRVGGLLKLARIVEAAEEYVSGGLSLESFGERVRMHLK